MIVPVVFEFDQIQPDTSPCKNTVLCTTGQFWFIYFSLTRTMCLRYGNIPLEGLFLGTMLESLIFALSVTILTEWLGKVLHFIKIF